MAQSFGGVSPSTKIYLFPMQNAQTGATGFYAFDPRLGFNDPVSSSVYRFKVEQVLPGRTPTVSRMILTYRDLGPFSATFALSGTSDQGTIIGNGTPANSSVTVSLGSALASGVLFTSVQDLALTAQNIQLSITRPPNSGPLSIAQIVLCGRVETKQEYA